MTYLDNQKYLKPGGDLMLTISIDSYNLQKKLQE